MTYLTGGIIGADLDKVYDTEEFALGTVMGGIDGNEWMFVEANGTITQYDCVAIDEDNLAVAITHALAAAGHTIGFSQLTLADGEYAWIPLRGSNVKVRAAASCAKDVQLYTTATAGVLDDTATSTAKLIRGVVLATVNGTAAVASVEVRATYPSGTATP